MNGGLQRALRWSDTFSHIYFELRATKRFLRRSPRVCERENSFKHAFWSRNDKRVIEFNCSLIISYSSVLITLNLYLANPLDVSVLILCWSKLGFRNIVR